MGFGRLVVYTEGAVKRLGQLYGTNKDIARIINSNEIQSVLRAKKEPKQLRASRQRKNPLKNQSVLGRLSPWALTVKKLARKAHVKGTSVQKAIAAKAKKTKDASQKWGKKSKAFYKDLQAAYNVAPKPAEGSTPADEE